MHTRRLLLVGPSGSGKTTLAESLASRFSVPVIAMEEFRMRLNRNVPFVMHAGQQVRAYDHPVYFDANAISHKMLAQIRARRGFIVEGAHLLQYPAIAHMAADDIANIEVVYLDIPHAVTLERRRRNNKGTLHDESFALIGESETAKHVTPQKLMPGVRVLDATRPVAELLAAIVSPVRELCR